MSLLRLKGPVPEGGGHFFVETVYPVVRETLDTSKARRFHEDYLEKTIWDWKLKYESVPA